MDLNLIKTALEIWGYVNDGIQLLNGHIEKKDAERQTIILREKEKIYNRSTDWINWRNSLPSAANPAMDAVSALAYAESAKHSPTIIYLISKVQELPKPVYSEVVTLRENLGKIESESVQVCAHLAELWNKHHMRNLPPQLQLANVISYRNELERLGSSSTIIKNFDIEIGRLAHAYTISRFSA